MSSLHPLSVHYLQLISVIMKKIWIISFLSLALITCQANENQGYDSLEEIAMSANDMGSMKVANALTTEAKVIKSGYLYMEVKSVMQAAEQLEKLLEAHEAYVVNSAIQDNRYQLSGEMAIRVKADNLEKLMGAAEKLALKVTNRSINRQDVTEEYVDVEARIKTKMEVRDKYRAMLSSAKTVEDILKIENELRVIQEELESRQARLTFLQSQVSFSTLTVSFFEVRPDFGTPHSKSFLTRVGEGLGKGWSGFQSFLVGVVYLWPFLLLTAVGLALFRRWRKNRRG
jgi:hypothetical protein